MISALEEDDGYFELCYNLQIAREHGQMKFENSPLPTRSFPPEGLCNYLGVLGVFSEDD